MRRSTSLWRYRPPGFELQAKKLEHPGRGCHSLSKIMPILSRPMDSGEFGPAGVNGSVSYSVSGDL